MIVDRFKHFLGGNQKMCHLPNCHFKVHLLEIEDLAKESRHAQLGSSASVGRAILSRNGDAWTVHRAGRSARWCGPA